MESKYAYLTFLKDIEQTDTNAQGEVVQFNMPYHEGQVDVMRVDEFQMFKREFPDRVSGNVMTVDKLVNTINYLYYDVLKKQIDELPEMDGYTRSRIENLEQMEFNGKLQPDNDSLDSIYDLVNKYISLQDCVRKEQRQSVTRTSMNR